MERRLLMLSYLFPPRGGAGVQRALKFAKYLPHFGWSSLIVANRESAFDRTTRVQDDALLKDLPTDTVVRYPELTTDDRAAMARGGQRWRVRLAATDTMGWWVGPAVRAGMALAHEHRPDAILVTMSPFTSAAAGIELKRQTGLPLVLDLRDPWALDETRLYPTRWHAWRDRRAMRRALDAADLVIMNTPRAKEAAIESFGVPASRVVCITNGFDPGDFRGSIIEPAGQERLRIVHTGMFHSELASLWDDWNARRGPMNRVKFARRPINLWTRTPRFLLAAMESALRGGVPARAIELVLVGEITAADRAMIGSSPLAASVRMLGYRSHDESVGWLQSADLLFLPNHTPLDGGPALVVPGKTYEYLGAGRPVLAMGGAGDMLDFVRQSSAGQAMAGDDIAGAAAFIRSLYAAKMNGKTDHRPDHSFVAQFERRELARRLAEQLDALLDRSQSRGNRP